jgi:3-oxoacyl-(acyl-carrier-protein) synthase
VQFLPVAITGLGLCSPLGDSPAATWNALVAGEFITDHSQAVGKYNPPRVIDLAERAARQAIAGAEWNLEQLQDAALVVGTSKGPVEAWLSSPAPRLHLGLSDVASELARRLKLGFVPRLTLSAACASGLHALIRGAMLIQQGYPRVIVVAAESSLHPLFLGSFQRLGVLAPAKFGCRPFDEDRAGFYVSEASAAVCLEAQSPLFSPSPCTQGDGWGGGLRVNPEPIADQKRPSPYPSPGVPGEGTRDQITVQIERFALAGDATHLTSADPAGRTLRRLFREVIDNRPVDLIHAHATGTVANDVIELAAIEETLALADAPTLPSFYSHKGALGHSLGVAGLVAVVLNCLAHKHGIVPPNIQTRRPLSMRKMTLSADSVDRPIHRSVALASGFGGSAAAVSFVRPVLKS